ncbi:MAG: biopolymer transporter ExbD [Planctomycetota bacterium]|jgi:hypothetical protein|nr:biopolymer transporter ExbD [Planctomycetota bacterium]
MAPPIDIDNDDEVKADMTPMIDVIFLLLIFFILTTKFIPDEKVIGSLLPTNKGQSSASTPIEEPQNVNILLYPFGYTRGQQPSYYDAKWHEEGGGQNATMTINGENIHINGQDLGMGGGEGSALNAQLDNIHGFINRHLTNGEKGGPRKDQDPVIIQCFSGMPWKFALAAYDAVRAYEAGVAGKIDLTPEDLQNAREVVFSPPRVRDYRQWEMGYELFEIIHTK